MSTERWDAIVVGGGPAGSASAARLAAFGHRVLLLDREEFPRPKACGDCVNPAGVEELERIGALEAVRAEPHTSVSGWRIVPQRGPSFHGDYPADRPGIGIARERLDRVLLAHAGEAGATIRTGVRVADLVWKQGRVAGVVTSGPGGRGEIQARLVIGADGLRSVVVRRLGLLRRPPRLRKLALTAHVQGLRGELTRGELHVLSWGSVGVAAIDGECFNVTVVVTGAEMEKVAGAREAYFDGALRRVPRLAGARRIGEVFATGPFDWPTRSAVAAGAMLVGDAAGYYDPFTGQGIFRALRGAALLAPVADGALRRDDPSVRSLQPYEEARLRAFDPGTRLQRALEEVLVRPRLLSAAAGMLARRPVVADTLIRVTGDLQPVRSLWSSSTLAQLLA